MSRFNYNISVEDNHILVTTDGVCTTIEQIIAYGEDIFLACQKKKTDLVLIDDRKLTYATSFWDDYNIATEVSTKTINRSYIKVAQVVKKDNLEISKQMETVFRNRGLDMKVFDSIEKAKEWLLNDN